MTVPALRELANVTEHDKNGDSLWGSGGWCPGVRTALSTGEGNKEDGDDWNHSHSCPHLIRSASPPVAYLGHSYVSDGQDFPSPDLNLSYKYWPVVFFVAAVVIIMI